MALNKDENALFFSSDGFLLNFIGSRLPNYSSRPTSIFQIGSGQLLKYKKGSLVPEVTSIAPFAMAGRRASGNRVWTPYGNNRDYADHWKPNLTGSGTGNTDVADAHSPLSYPMRPGAREAMNGKAYIAGEIRKIPEPHLEMLTQWYTLEPGQEYMFVAEKWHSWGNDNGAIYGKMWHPEWKCFVNAYMPDGTYLSMKGRNYPWTATPIGVDHTTH